MELRTLGTVALEATGFARPKPLLLLVFLALEGRQDRRHVAELFWPDAADHMKSLTVALTRLRQGAPGAVDADADQVWATVETDALRFLSLLDEGAPEEALALYAGPFLHGFYLKAWSAELEEWLYRTREHLAGRARLAMLALAERSAARGHFDEAARRAEEAWQVAGSPPLEHEELVRLHTLLRSGGSAFAGAVRAEAAGFGIDLALSVSQARGRLARDPTSLGHGRPSTLPTRATTFVGRDVELSEVATHLSRRTCPVITLVGPPGVGKTRLAVQAAREQHALEAFGGGVHYVPLESVTSADALPHAIAAALGLVLDDGARPLDPVCDALRGSDVLLVCDNVEHLLRMEGGASGSDPDAASIVAQLVAACPELTLLVTSRVRLHLEEERAIVVGGLAYPTGADASRDAALRSDAVTMFARRARRARADFVLHDDDVEHVLTICRLVEGLPLALELAAGWVRVMPVRDIVAALEEGLDLLATPVRNVPGRHRSMRAAFDGSWRLLTERQRRVVRRLAVCRGGFGREGARAVAGATIADLASLVDASMLRVDVAGRYDRHPLVLEYALEQLAEHPDERDDARARHRAHYVGVLRGWEGELAGGGRQDEALIRVEAELENVLHAWRESAREGAATEVWEACRPLQLFFIQRGGLAREAVEAFAEASALLGDRASDALGGRLLVGEAWFRFLLGDTDRSEATALRGVAMLRTGPAPEDASTGPIGRALTSGLNTLGQVAKRRGDAERAETCFREALEVARAGRNDAQVAIMTNNVALLRTMMGDYAEAERLYGEALAINRERRNSRSIVRNLANLGSLMVAAGSGEAAERFLGEGVELAESIGYTELLPDLLVAQGGAALLTGAHDRARACYSGALERRRAHGERALEAAAHLGLGRVDAAQGRHAAAEAHLGTALGLAWEIDYLEAVCASLLTLAELHASRGAAPEAATLLGALRARPTSSALAARIDALATKLASLPAGAAALERSVGLPLEQVVASVLRGAEFDAAT